MRYNGISQSFVSHRAICRPQTQQSYGNYISDRKRVQSIAKRFNNTERAPVHVITGSAGCKEGRDTFKHNPSPWSAFRSQDYGYSKLAAVNKTHIYMEQVSVEQSGQAIDAFWLVKDKKLRFD